MRASARPSSTARPLALVVSHEASRTGAPRMVVEILRGLRGAGFETLLVHRWGGPLRPELDREADGNRLEPLARVRASLRLRRRTRRLALLVERAGVWWALRRHRPALVWCNTVLSAPYLAPARALGTPVVLHVHELEGEARPILERYGLAGPDAADALAQVELVGCSAPVADDLSRLVGVTRSTIAVLSSAVDVDGIRARGAAVDGTGTRPDEAGGRVRIVACGLGNERKGIDLFCRLAVLLDEREPGRFDCTWVGDVEELHREKAAGTSVHLAGPAADPVPQLASADVFVLTSRADAFPLVVLEAMALARPVVAFAVGGVPEQLGDTGVLVPPLDVETMAAAIQELADDPTRRTELGDRAHERVRASWGADAFHRGVAAVASRAIHGL